jgi:hypothetical protein
VTTTEPATTTADPTTTTASPAEEWVTVVSQLYQRQFELQSNPDPNDQAAIEAIMAPTCSCYQRLLAAIQDLSTRGYHVVGTGPTIVSVEVAGEPSSTPGRVPVVRLTVVSDPADDVRLVDGRGNEVQQAGPRPPVRSSIALAADGPAGSWRLHDEIVLGEA